MKKPQYAKHTHISTDATHLEVNRIVVRYGGDRFRYYSDPAHRRGVYTFSVPGAGPISYAVPHYDRLTGVDLPPQQLRARYRAAFKGIHMRFEQIEAGIETPAQAFHAHIVIDEATGETLFERTQHLLPPSVRRAS